MVAAGDRSDLDEARRLMARVEAGDLVFAEALCAEPTVLMTLFRERAAELDRVHLASGMFLSDYGFLDVPSIRYRTWFPPGTLLGVADDRVEYLPMSWSQVDGWLRRRARIRVALIQVSPADEDGYHSFGPSASITEAAAESAEFVIAEVNDQMPVTYGSRIHRSRIHASVHVSRPLPPFPRRAPQEVDDRIAAHIAPLIEDGATLQVGVGSIPDAVLARLAAEGRRDLRVLGAATQGLLALDTAGALAAGESVLVGEVLGDEKLYKYVDRNPKVAVVGAARTHDARQLATVERLTSVNSALEVDLFGQVNSEYVDGAHLGAVGGAADFAHAASWPGNTSILALRATARRGTVSRITRSLAAASVSLPRDLAQFVVTEFGVADLRDKTVRERARALAAVAHPRFRPELEAAAATM